MSPDGKTLASGEFNGTLRLWDAATGKELARAQAHGREVEALAFAPDGKALATAGLEHVIHLWDPATGKRLLTHPAHDSTTYIVAFTPDGKRIASVGSDRIVRFWDPATGQELQALRGLQRWVCCAAFSPDGRTFAAGGDGVIKLWEVATGKELRALSLDRANSEVLSLAFSPDGQTLASGSWEGGVTANTVRLWDLQTGKELRRLQEAKGHGFWAVRFTPDGKTLAVQGESGLLLDVATGQELRRFASRGGLALSPNGRLLATGGEDNAVRLQDVSTGKEMTRFGQLGDERTHFAFTPDGRALTWAPGPGNDRAVRLWEVLSGQVRRQFEGHQGPVTAVALSPDGTRLVSASEDTTLLVWDLTGARKAAGLAPRELLALWADLGSEDAARAYTAVCTLSRAGDQGVPLVRERLRPAPVPDAGRVARLLADLNSEKFPVRDGARRELEQLGELVEAELRGALGGNPPLEVRRRIEGLLQRLSGPVTSPEQLRALRAVEVLERAGTPEARSALKALAAGAPAARLTQEAQAALGRLAQRPAPGR
jgi:WD40 repeat protein